MRRLIELASVLVALSLVSSLAAAQDAVVQQKQELPDDSSRGRKAAAAHFSKGLEFHSQLEYKLALIEFERAYELVPDYRVLYNVGQVAIELTSFARARVALRTYLRQGGDKIPDARQQQVRLDLKMLRARTAELSLECLPKGAVVKVDGLAIPSQELTEPLLLDAGEHRVEATLSGYQEAFVRTILAGAEQRTLCVQMQATPGPSPLPPGRAQPAVENRQNEVPVANPQSIEPPNERKTALSARGRFLRFSIPIAGGLIAGAATAGVVGVSSAKKASKVGQSPAPSAERYDRLTSGAERAFLVADVLAAASALTAGVSVYVASRRGALERSVPKRSARLRVAHDRLIWSMNF